MNLTKTDFLLFLEAPMHLWAKTHDQFETRWRTPYEEFLLRQGQCIESLAKAYLEGPFLAEHPGCQISWQPSFEDGLYQIRADALIQDPRTEAWDLYEVKSATSVRRQHALDLTFQVLLLEGVLDLRHVHILHLNRDYQQSTNLDLKTFFTTSEVSAQVEKTREEVEKARRAAREIIVAPQPHPDWACTKPETCPCAHLCHTNLPKNPIYNIPRIGKKARELRRQGIRAMEEIPEEFPLNPKQKRHLAAVRKQQAVVDVDAIRKSLADLRYPLHFLDYETFNPAVPLYPSYRPYEPVIFQYSLHRVDAPGEAPQHFEALVTEVCDPAPRIAASLLSHIQPRGSVVVWNKSFEARCNQELAAHHPEEAETLLALNGRLFDLMLPFRNAHYVHPDFHGSASLKAVLPVLCPDLDYANLNISKGEDAMLTWWQLQQSGADTDPAERAEMEAALRAYCQRDTLALVAVWRFLQQILAKQTA
jgi:hypothetical protein